MARSVLEIILRLKGDKARQELKKVDKEFDKVEKSARQSSKGIKGFNTDLLKMGVVVGGATAGAVALGKAIWDMGKKGAIVEQTEKSFEGLLQQWEIAPGLLEEMRQATRGTVDDMTLMQGTLTLVAGTTKELGEELFKAAPRLLEISKAANKLNPALGDTAFLYESITAGIKRNSKQVLDNLGIVFSSERAYSRYAEKIGKTADALNDTEKALATLDIVASEAGENLINQVGGNLDATGDAMARSEVATKNLSDELSKFAAHVLPGVSEALAEVLKDSREGMEANAAYRKAVALGITTEEAWREELERVGKAGLTSAEMMEWLNKETERWISNMDLSEEGMYKVTDGLKEIRDEMLAAADASGEMSLEMRLKLKETNEAAAKTAEEFRKLREMRIEDFFDVDIGIGDVAARLFDITLFKEFGGEALEAMVDEVKAGLAEGQITNEQAREFFKNIAIEAEAIKVQMGEISAAEAAESIAEDFNMPLTESRELVDAVVEGLDLVNEADISRISGALEALEGRKAKIMEREEILWDVDPQGEAESVLDGLQEQINLMTAEPWVLEIQVLVTGDPIPDGGKIPNVVVPGETGQHGLDMVVPPGFPNDSFPIWTSSGEHVSVTPKGKAGAGNVINNTTHNHHYYDEGAAALGLAVVRQGRREVLNASMGR
jgi:hypothetical protein